MKKLFFIMPLMLSGNFYASAQMEEPIDRRVLPYASPATYHTGGIITVEKDLPLIIINTLETNAPSLIMDYNNLRIVKRYDEPKELMHFGDKGNSGIIVAELKTKIPLLRLEEVLDYFKVPADNRHLQVLVDKKIINPALFLADVKKIQKVEVFEVTQEDVLASFYVNKWVKGDKYLNIVTVPK